MTAPATGTARLAALALGLALATAACGRDDVPLLPSASGPTTPGATTGDPASLGFGLDLEALKAQAQLAVGTRQLIARGFQCGWHGGWMRTVKDARHEQPSAFRKTALGGAFTFGLVMLVAGVAATMFLAWLLPRSKRRRARDTDGARAETPPGWYAYFKDLGLRALHRVGRFLHVELFDPVLASQRTQAVYVARDAERQLTVALECVAQLAPPPPSRPAPRPPEPASPSPDAASPEAPSPSPEAPSPDAVVLAPDLATPAAEPPIPSASDDVRAALAAWRAELQTLRGRLEGSGALPRELSADVVLPRLEDIRRAARELRVGLERLVVARAGLDTSWTLWTQRIADRPRTPREQTAAPGALPAWVRPVGLGGLGALALATPMMAAWMAAGAFPLFFAFLFAAGGLGAVLVARVHLHRAGRLPLLPGFADRVASWLTTLSALAFTAMVLSSWMSSESGLDLGDPPPVPVPDPIALQAPDLWTSTKP